MNQNPILEAWNDNTITLNEARIGLGLAPDLFYGHQYKFELFGDLQVEPAEVIERELDEYAEKLVAAQDEQFDAFASMLERSFEDLKRKVVHSTYQGKKSVNSADADDILDDILKQIEDHQDEFAKQYQSHVIEAFEKSGRVAADYVRGEFNTQTLEAKAEIKNLTSQYVERQMKRVHEDVSKILDQAIEEDWKRTKLRDEIRAQFNNYIKQLPRAVKTESTRISNSAAKIAYVINGVKEIKWHAEPGACEHCKKLSKRIIKPNQAFYNEGQQVATADEEGKVSVMNINYGDVKYPPLHPNCRCSLVPVFAVMDEDIPPSKRNWSQPLNIESVNESQLQTSENFWRDEFKGKKRGKLAQNTKIGAARGILNRLKRDRMTMHRLDSFGRFLEEGGFIKPKDSAYSPYKTPAEKAVASMIRMWQTGSGSSGFSLALQDAARKEFGLAGSSVRHLREKNADKAEPFLAYEDVLRRFLRAQYDQTQDLLARMGVDHVHAYRGQKLREKDLGIKPDGSPHISGHRLQPMSSFTVNLDVAKSAAWKGSGDYKAVFGAKIPRERILSMPQTGAGSLQREEVIVMGQIEDKDDMLWTALFDKKERMRTEDVREKITQASELAEMLLRKPIRNLGKIEKVPPVPSVDPTIKGDYKVEVNKVLDKGVKSERDAVKVGKHLYNEIEKRYEKEYDKYEQAMIRLDEEFNEAVLFNDEKKKEQVKDDMDRQTQGILMKKVQLRLDVLKEFRDFGYKEITQLVGNPRQGLPVTNAKPIFQQGLKKVAKYLPHDWLEESIYEEVYAGIYNKPDFEGAFYYRSENLFVFSQFLDISIEQAILHEMAHRMEHMIPEIVKLEKEYYLRRTEGWIEDTLNNIAKRYGDEDGFDERLMGRMPVNPQDGFNDYYRGVFYKNPQGKYTGFELLSTALEEMFIWDCEYDLERDPETAKFIMGLLAGVKGDIIDI